MPCPITADEVTRLDGIVAAVAAAQEATPGERYAQARAGHPEEFLALGLTQADLEDAALLGFSSQGVDEYVAGGVAGWAWPIVLRRGGEAWRRVFHAGPQAWRATDWEPIREETPPWP